MSSEKARGSQIQLPGGLLPDVLSSMQGDINSKASTVDVTDALALKADASALAAKADTVDVNNALALKADTSALADKADTVDVNNALAAKADTVDVNNALALKADASALAAKADTVDVNNALALKADASALDSKLSDAASDTKMYARKDAAWVEVPGGLDVVQGRGTSTTAVMSQNAATQEFVEDAPNDGKTYSRKNKSWTEATGSSLLRMEYISGAKTLTEVDAGKTFVVTASATVTLPTGPSDGWAVELLMSDASAGSTRTVTWAKDAGDTIRGGVTVATGDCAVVYLDNVFIVTGAQE